MEVGQGSFTTLKKLFTRHGGEWERARGYGIGDSLPVLEGKR